MAYLADTRLIENYLYNKHSLRIGILDNTSYYQDRKVKTIIDTLTTIFNNARDAIYSIYIKTEPLKGEVFLNLRSFKIPKQNIKIFDTDLLKDINDDVYDSAEYRYMFKLFETPLDVIFFYTDHLEDVVETFIKTAKTYGTKVITIRSDGDIIDWDNPPERVDDNKVYGGY